MSVDLYQQIILEHNKRPKNFGKIENAKFFSEGFNPLCGDHVFVYIDIGDDQLVKDVAFESEGCAICKASASMMTVAIKGLSLDNVSNISEMFKRAIVDTLVTESFPVELGKLSIFSGIRKYPSRVKCALLAWHTLDSALKSNPEIITEDMD